VSEQESDWPRKEIMRGAKESDVAEQREEQADTDPERIVLFEPKPIGKRERENTDGGKRREQVGLEWSFCAWR
jgi:hypothetical protein